MTPDRGRTADCVLGEGIPCPRECRQAGRCVVLRIRQKNGVERTGVPLVVVGETLRFRQVLPKPAILLLPLSSLEPDSAELAVAGAAARDDDGDPRAARGTSARGARGGDR